MGRCGSFVIAAALLFASSIFPSVVRAQLAETPEEASRFLAGLINSKVLVVDVGNGIVGEWGSRRVAYSMSGVFRGYRKSMFGKWKEVTVHPTTVVLEYDIGAVDGAMPGGGRDACSLSIPRIDVRKKQKFVLPVVGRTAVVTVAGKVTQFYGDEEKRVVIELDEDPFSLRFAPRSIDWAKVEFSRERSAMHDRYVFTFHSASDGVAPYTSLTVQGGIVADQVENAIRVLQLGCAG